MNYKANFHTDIKINNSIKIDILKKDKIISTGYLPNTKNRPLNNARKMNRGDTIVIRLFSYSNALKNPNEPYLILTSVDNVNQFEMNCEEMKAHKEILLPLVNNITTKTYKNKRHNWFDDWNIETIVFGIKVNDWREEDIFTFNDIQNELETSLLYKVGNYKYISSSYQKVN